MINGDKRNERHFKDEVQRRYDIDPALLEQLPNLLDGTLDNVADLLGQGIDWLKDVLGAYQSTKEQADQLLDWLNETFKSNFSELTDAVEQFFEDKIDGKIEVELRKRATKLNVSREELLRRRAEIRAAVVADIAVKLKFHAQNFVDGYAAYEALQAASGLAPAHQSVHVQRFEDRFSSIFRRFATADEKVTDLSVIEALRRSETLSVERIFQEEIGELHGALVNELLRTFGAAGGIARAFIEVDKKGELSSANAKIIAKNFVEILKGSATGVAAAEKALRKGTSLKARVLGWIFNIRTAALGAGAAVLVALGFVIQAVPDNWLLGIPDNVWSGILYSIGLIALGLGLIFGLMRIGGIARLAVLTVIFGGVAVAIYLSGPCRWSFQAWSWTCPTQQTAGLQDGGPSLFNTPAPDFDKQALCEEVGEFFPSDGDGNLSRCVPVLFATNRSHSDRKDAEGRDIVFDEELAGQLSFGIASMAIPVMEKEWGREDGIALITPRLRKALEKGGVDSNRVKARALILERRAGKDAEIKNLSDVMGVSRIVEYSGHVESEESNAEIERRFVESINASVDRESKSALLYIHGFNTTYRTSLMSAAHLQEYIASMSGSENPLRDVGVPIVFSPSYSPPRRF